jgi:hypothetical protein
MDKRLFFIFKIFIFELLKDHEESKFWFNSLIGYFYQNGIGCKIITIFKMVYAVYL